MNTVSRGHPFIVRFFIRGRLGEGYRVFFTESDVLVRVGSLAGLMTEGAPFVFYFLEEIKHELDLLLHVKSRCEEFFKLERNLVFKHLRQHSEDVLHEGIVVLSE